MGKWNESGKTAKDRSFYVTLKQALSYLQEKSVVREGKGKRERKEGRKV
jgi:hypothetical protein